MKHCVGRLNRCCTYDRLGNSVFTVMIQPMFIYAITITIITITIIIITFTITRLCWTPTQLLARGRAAASVAVSRALSGIFSYIISSEPDSQVHARCATLHNITLHCSALHVCVIAVHLITRSIPPQCAKGQLLRVLNESLRFKVQIL